MRDIWRNAVLLAALVVFLPFAIAVEDQYRPYLHKAEVPDHPGVKLYGSYATVLFPGAATYSYPIEVPKGTNGLQPSFSITYNSQSAKGRPGILGAGWTLTQSYIARDANTTFRNATDDKFKLVLEGSSHDLIYDASDGFYHTKTETYIRIQNLTNASNTYGLYWLVTSKDGAQYRFGYTNASELESGLGYALRWSLDQVTDTHGNKIFYSYSEDPNPEDNGTAYLSSIQYNSDRKREIKFIYESTARPDIRSVWEQGNYLKESRRLEAINVSANGNLVRRYELQYTNLNPERTLSSVSSIRRLGSDLSLLGKVNFTYYSSSPNFTRFNTDFVAPRFMSITWESDAGARFVDLNRDGYVDFVVGRKSTSEKKSFLNLGNGTWQDAGGRWALPDFISNTDDRDNGTRFVDFTSDGLVDILVSNNIGTYRDAWINNGSHFIDAPEAWNPPPFFLENTNETGVQFADINGDGRVDMLQSAQFGNPFHFYKKAYINNGSGWVDQTSVWWSDPWDDEYMYFNSDGADTGVRLEDINGDGLPDVVKAHDGAGPYVRQVWLNNGSGWINETSPTSSWLSPAVFTNASIDTGTRLMDINGDGLTDVLESWAAGTNIRVHAWLNNGSGWHQNDSWSAPDNFMNEWHNIGRRPVDMNGDGHADIAVSYETASEKFNFTWIQNATNPFLLKTITTELGGTVTISYNRSTYFNNTGNDSLSDLGFNVWVVANVTHNNSMIGDFAVFGNTSYSYANGSYDYATQEFVGFANVTERLSDSSYVVHYFHQDEARKGREYRTETYSPSGTMFSKQETFFNTTNRTGYFLVHQLWQTSYLYDGASTPRVTGANYTYDSFGNVKTVLSQGDFSVTGDEKYERFSYVNNSSSWIILPSKTQLFASDNLTKIRETRYWYDSLSHGATPRKGDVTQVQQWLDGNAGPTARMEYDSFGNIVRVTDPLGRETQYIYNVRDATHTYADKIINALGHAMDFSHDLGTGNLFWTRKNGITTQFQYDSFGRIQKEIEPYDSSELPTKEYTYSFDGTAPESIKISQRTTANKTFDTYFYYDGLANFIQLKSPSDGGLQIAKNFLYDTSGRVVSEQNPYFVSFSTNLANVSSSAPFVNYTYDTLGRVVRVTNQDGSNKTIVFDRSTITAYDELSHRKSYVLDGFDRIINVLEYNNDPVNKFNFETDVYNTSYEYDTADQLTKITDALGNTYTFSYDSLGRRVSLKDPDLGNWSYQYDLSGSLVRQTQSGGGSLVSGDGYYREYDGLNQLIRVRNGSSSNSPTLEEYSYDPFGQRVLITRNDSAQTKIYTPFKEIMMISNTSGNYTYYYVYQDDALVARVNPDGSKFFYHPDHLGSTSLITDQSGNVVENTFYSPYGEILGGGSVEDKSYTGQFADEISCQDYYGARYYSPCWGMFSQPDKLIYRVYNPQYLNRYMYVLGNPYRYTDPNGLWALQIGGTYSWSAVAGGTGGLGLAIAYDEETKDLQFGVYMYEGAGVVLGGEFGGYVAAEGSYTPSAKKIADLNGKGATVGVQGDAAGHLGFQKTYTPDLKQQTSTGVSIGVGAKGPVPLTASIHYTDTQVTKPLTINLKDKSEKSVSADNSAKQEGKQTTSQSSDRASSVKEGKRQSSSTTLLFRFISYVIRTYSQGGNKK